MQIRLASVMVDNQDAALAFYVGKLGFEVVHDIPMGQFRWLTVASPEGVEGMELVLEPMGFPPARDFQKALFDAGIPATAFFTDDIETEYARLVAAGVVFRMPPKPLGAVVGATFEDGCGNLIHLVQPQAAG
jgi:catechol 2,3-dioxygenase-like lactoylglutathione lyase family enzyme